MKDAAERDARGALGTILAVAAHELGSPMTGILAFARYAAQHSDPQGRIHELLLDIEREALRCTATIQDLLLFSRVSGLEEPARVQLADLVPAALAEVAPPIERPRIAVAFEVEPGTPQICVQVCSVQRALVSLLSSAIDALTASRTAQPRICVRGAPDADGVVLALADNGPGTGAKGVRGGQALARAILVTQSGTLTLHEHAHEFSVRVWLPSAPR